MGCSFGVVPNYPNDPNYRRKQLQTINDSNETSVSVSSWCYGLASRLTQTLLEKNTSFARYFSEWFSNLPSPGSMAGFFMFLVNPS
jgi:hypothetical protein